MKKLFFKRMLSLVLALVLLIGLLPYSIPTANAAAGPSATVTIDGLTYTFTVTQHTVLGTDFLGYGKNLRITAQRNGNTIDFDVEWDYYDPLVGQDLVFSRSLSFNDSNCASALSTSVNDSLPQMRYFVTIAITREAASHTGATNCGNAECTRCGSTVFNHDYTYQRDATHHWQVCANDASHTTAKQPHTGGTPTCITTGTCSSCNAQYYVDHVFDTKWAWDNDQHYHPCKTAGCTVRSNEDACTYTELTCTEDSVCTVCQKVKQTAQGHDFTYTLNPGTTNVLLETCSNGCGHSETATLAVPESVNYNGSEITPAEITYSDNWQGEQPAAISYADNLNVGTATAKITVEGCELNAAFQINKPNLSDAVITLSPEAGTYTGSAYAPALCVVWFGETLTEGTDYKATWDKTGFANADTYTVTVSGIGNYEGSVDKTFCVDAADITDIKVEQVGSLTYETGKVLTPSVSVNAATVNNQPVTFTYSMLEDGTYGDMPSFENAGTHTVYYKVSAPNHKTATGTFTVTINKTHCTYEPPVALELYGNGYQQSLVKEGIVYGGRMRYALGEDNINAPKTGWDRDVPRGNETGIYYVWYLIIGDENHFDVAPACVEVRINRTPPIVSKTNETIFGKCDGKITGLNTNMEYRKDGESTYTAITTTELTGLAAGTYFFRYAELNGKLPSPDRKVVIEEGRKLTVRVPQNQVGYTFTSSVNEVSWMEEFTVGLEIHEGYSKTEAFRYTLNGTEYNDRIEDGIDEFTGADTNFVFGIEGIADITAPAAEIQVSDNKWNQFWNDITFGLFFNKTQDVTITADDKGSGLAAVYYYLADSELALEEVTAISDWQAYNGTFQINPENKYVIYAKAVDQDGNTAYINSEDGIVLDSIAPVISGIEDGSACYTTQAFTVADDNLDTVTVNGTVVTDDYVLTGNVEAVYTVTATDKAGNVTTVTVNMKPIQALAAATEHLDDSNVTSDDAAALESLVEQLDALINDPDTFVAEEKDLLNQQKENAEGLLAIIDAAAQAPVTENTEKVQDVTDQNVTPEDKADLEQAKDDLESALATYGNNYTEAERKAIEDEITRIEGALDVLERVEAVEELIGKIPATITKKDAAAVQAAEAAYNDLSNYEKSLVDAAAKKVLDNAVAALAACKDTYPNTGDTTRLGLWFALLFLSSAALVGLFVYSKKKHYSAK